MILAYAQIANSSPLLYVEFILYYSLLLIWLGRILRTVYKKYWPKRFDNKLNQQTEMTPVVISIKEGMKVISLDVLRLGTETKSLK